MKRQIRFFVLSSSAFGAGLLYGYSFTNETAGYLLPIPALILLLWTLSQLKTKLTATLCGILSGIGAGTTALHWLYPVVHITWHGIRLGSLLWIGVTVLFGASSFGLFAWLAKKSQEAVAKKFLPLSFACAWVAAEFFRTTILGGLQWYLLGYTLIPLTPLIQIAEFVGVWGLSFWLALSTGFLLSLFSKKLSLDKKTLLVYASVILGVPLISLFQWFNLKEQLTPQMTISILHEKIPQEQKWDPQRQKSIIDKFLALAQEAQKTNPDLIIWPEASYPSVLQRIPTSLKDVIHLPSEIQRLKGAHLIGAVTEVFISYNSALLIKEGRLIDYYDKVTLLPFGEFIPLGKAFSNWIEPLTAFDNTRPGKEQNLLKISDAFHAGITICYESAFPKLSETLSKKGAKLLVNLSNDAWFKETPLIHQHFWVNPIRAIENRLPLARASNNGISAIIDPLGRVAAKLKPDQTGILTAQTQELKFRDNNPWLKNHLRKGFPVFVIGILVYLIWFNRLSIPSFAGINRLRARRKRRLP